MMIRAHKIRLNPTADQANYLMRAAGTARYSYNWAVAQWKEADGKKPSALDLKKQFNASKPAWTYEVTKCAAEGAFSDFATAVRNHRAGRTGPPTFRSRNRGDLSFHLNNDKFDVSGFFIKIPKLGLVNMVEKLRLQGKILSAVVSKEADWWYVSITVEMPGKYPAAPEREVGIDVGILRLATLSDGGFLENERPLRHALKRLACLQRVLARKQKGSRNYEKVKDQLARLHKTIRNIRNDILHKFTTWVSETYRFVGVEDLNVKGMTHNHCLALSLQDAALGKLLRLLDTKVQSRGGQVIQVGRNFPSTKLCSNCGHKQDLALEVRVYSCPTCQLQLDRDLNASINILKHALHLSQQTAVTV